MQPVAPSNMPARLKPPTWRSGLVADTDTAIGRLLSRRLPEQGFSVRLAQSADDVLAASSQHGPDVIILGGDMPDMAALDLVAQVEARSGPPLLLLLSNPTEFDIVNALDAGAADCMHKPFLIGELAARLRKLIRWRLMRQGVVAGIRTDTLDLDVVRWRITVRGVEIRLSSKEQAVLSALVEAMGNVVSTEELCVGVWGSTRRPGEARIRPIVHNLRRKLDLTPESDVRLLSELQVGYRLVLPRRSGLPSSSMAV